MHESRPLFEKSRDVYRSMSKRFSSRMSEINSTQDIETSVGFEKSEIQERGGEAVADEAVEVIVDEDSLHENEIPNKS